MGWTTSIAWTDSTWSPLRGCSRVSPGCQHCYAEAMAARFSDPGYPYHGFAKRTKDGPRWTGRVRLIPAVLEQPLHWRKPRRVFVNSMSDLFHEAVSDDTIERIFAVMASAPQHRFQVLTKRQHRMAEWFSDKSGPRAMNVRGWAYRMFQDKLLREPPTDFFWPLPNVWLGVSVENQATADARIPLLLQTPAAVRFLSVEPMLGPVDLSRWFSCGPTAHLGPCALHRPQWVICGGESGPKARPCNVAWIRSVVEQCRASGVRCFVKQLGAKAELLLGAEERPDAKGGNPTQWPRDLRVREFPEVPHAGA